MLAQPPNAGRRRWHQHFVAAWHDNRKALIVTEVAVELRGGSWIGAFSRLHQSDHPGIFAKRFRSVSAWNHGWALLQ